MTPPPPGEVRADETVYLSDPEQMVPFRIRAVGVENDLFRTEAATPRLALGRFVYALRRTPKYRDAAAAATFHLDPKAMDYARIGSFVYYAVQA